MPKYNGHRNYNHWNVALWILNSENYYRHARYLISQEGTKNAAARLLLNALPDKTPDGAPYTFSSVRAALRGL